MGAVNAAAAVWTVRRAGRVEASQALFLVLGGMGIRMMVVLAAIAVVLVAFEVQRIEFVAGLGITFVLGVAAEVSLLLSQRSQEQTPADA